MVFSRIVALRRTSPVHVKKEGCRRGPKQRSQAAEGRERKPQLGEGGRLAAIEANEALEGIGDIPRLRLGAVDICSGLAPHLFPASLQRSTKFRGLRNTRLAEELPKSKKLATEEIRSGPAFLGAGQLALASRGTALPARWREIGPNFADSELC